MWRYLALGYFIIILLGSILLILPFATKDGQKTNYLNALFTATSASCVTGLVPYDTGIHWSTFGQIVILLLIQMGGLGFTTFVSIVFLFARRELGVQERKVVMQSYGGQSYRGIGTLIKRIMIGSLLIEFIGASLLCISFVPKFGGMGVYYDQIFSHSEFLVLAFISMAAAGFYVFGMNQIYLEQEKSSQYHSQISVYKMLTEQYRQSERLRHDMKNHIIALTALSRNKEWEKIEDYLKNMEGVILDAGGDLTGNKAVDALLYQKRKQAEGEDIKWECDMQMPKGCCINEFDLCVLMGNILDNALEACGRMQKDENRFINIQARTVKKCFLIEVKNSMDRTEKFTEGFTNKDDSQEHGIGLLNVGDVVNRYNGAVHKEAGKGIFVISILMPFPDTAHDTKTAV